MNTIAGEAVNLFGGTSSAIVYFISFVLAFMAALGRGFLLNKPPLFSQRIADAILCGVIAVPITGIAIEEHSLSIWWTWACVFCFGSLGFMVFYEFIRDLVPDIKRILLQKAGGR